MRPHHWSFWNDIQGMEDLKYIFGRRGLARYHVIDLLFI